MHELFMERDALCPCDLMELKNQDPKHLFQDFSIITIRIEHTIRLLKLHYHHYGIDVAYIYFRIQNVITYVKEECNKIAFIN